METKKIGTFPFRLVPANFRRLQRMILKRVLGTTASDHARYSAGVSISSTAFEQGLHFTNVKRAFYEDSASQISNLCGLLKLQSRFRGKRLRLLVDGPQNGAALLKGITEADETVAQKGRDKAPFP